MLKTVCQSYGKARHHIILLTVFPTSFKLWNVFFIHSWNLSVRRATFHILCVDVNLKCLNISRIHQLKNLQFIVQPLRSCFLAYQLKVMLQLVTSWSLFEFGSIWFSLETSLNRNIIWDEEFWGHLKQLYTRRSLETPDSNFIYFFYMFCWNQ